MTDKMREDATREAARNAALDEYFKARPQLLRTRHEECLFEAGFDRAWQAAKSVPVAGEPVAWLNFNKQGDVTRAMKCRDSWCKTPVYLKPTTSITEAELKDLRMCKIAAREEARRVDELTAELERLRKDAERWRKLRAMDWFDSPFCVVRDPKGRISPGSDCPPGTRLDSFIDAIEDEKK